SCSFCCCAQSVNDLEQCAVVLLVILGHPADLGPYPQFVGAFRLLFVEFVHPLIANICERVRLGHASPPSFSACSPSSWARVRPPCKCGCRLRGAAQTTIQCRPARPRPRSDASS